MTDFWRKVVVRLGYCGASLVILAALLVSVTNLLTPLLNAHRTDFEKLAARLLNRPVHITNVSIFWNVYEPELVFQNVTVLDLQTHEPTIQIPLIKIDVAILNSLFARTILLDSLEIKGVRFTLHEKKPGEVSVEGFDQLLLTDNLTGHSLNPNMVLTWIFSQPRLILKNFDIQYFSNKGTEKDITLKVLELSNTTHTHQLAGSATLNQTIPTQIAIRFNWEGNITDFSHVSANLSLDLKNISLTQWFAKEGWHGLYVKKGIGNARVSAQWKNNAWQKIQSDFQFRDIAILLDQVFDNTLKFDQLTGSVNGQKDAAGAWLFTTKNIQAINEDVNAQTSLSMTIPVNDSPVIDLKSHFTLFHAKNVSFYLPLKIYDPELNHWLRRAFLDGQVIAGNAVVQGRLKDFPFDHGSGKFEIGGVVKDVELRYAPDWPLMHDINGKLLFSGRSMAVDIVSAKILDVPLQNIHAEIPDLGVDPVLTTKSLVQMDLAQGLRFIQKSPLQYTVGKNLQALQLQGPMQLALSLAVPLNHPGDVKLTGDTTLANAILNLPVWNLAINQLTGAFRFTENSISASNMTGQLFGHPVSLDLQTQQVGHVTATLQGDISTTDLTSWLGLPVEDLMQGTAHYNAKLFLTPPHDSSQPTQISIHSDLKGIAVNLPGNYGKKIAETANFQSDFFIQENQPIKARVFYNKLFSLGLVLQRVQQKLTLLSADLHLGSGDATWPAQPGIIVTGQVDRLDLDKLTPYISQFTDKPRLSTQKNNKIGIDANLFRALTIQAKTVIYSGFQLNNLAIQLSKSSESYILGLNNADMSGQIILPRGGIQQGIQARFQRLNLSTQVAAGRQNPVNPRNLPPISFIGEDVRYGEMRLGRVILNLVPDASGLAVKQLDLVSNSYTLHATGNWTNARSRVQGNLTTTHVTDLLTSWGFSSSNLIGSSGNADFDLSWPDGFFRPSMQGLSGNISLKLGEGHIINLGNAADAKMGLGRLLNIFSLQSLPRRLSLNFSDLFEKGYSFDSLKGDFILHDGNAITQNTRFKGPVAMIEISGRIGLAAKDLDMKISVTPHVTGSLPVVAAIATANPIAGVAAWVVTKMVTPAVSHMTTYDYSITGSWANPVWNQIKAGQGSSSSAGGRG